MITLLLCISTMDDYVPTLERKDPTITPSCSIVVTAKHICLNIALSSDHFCTQVRHWAIYNQSKIIDRL